MTILCRLWVICSCDSGLAGLEDLIGRSPILQYVCTVPGARCQGQNHMSFFWHEGRQKVRSLWYVVLCASLHARIPTHPHRCTHTSTHKQVNTGRDADEGHTHTHMCTHTHINMQRGTPTHTPCKDPQTQSHVCTCPCTQLDIEGPPRYVESGVQMLQVYIIRPTGSCT